MGTRTRVESEEAGNRAGSKGGAKLVDKDGFTVIKTRNKPIPIPATSPKPQEEAPISPYHPDFGQIRSPSDALIQTGDGFAMIDHETLWPRREPFRSTSVLNILAIDSPTFAFIAHTLLLDYFAGQRVLRLEEPLIDIPPGMVDGKAAKKLRDAIKFAKSWGIVDFVSIVTPYMSAYAEGLLNAQSYHDYEVGSQIKRMLGL